VLLLSIMTHGSSGQEKRGLLDEALSEWRTRSGTRQEGYKVVRKICLGDSKIVQQSSPIANLYASSVISRRDFTETPLISVSLRLDP
jgi:hypothetical protein